VTTSRRFSVVTALRWKNKARGCGKKATDDTQETLDRYLRYEAFLYSCRLALQVAKASIDGLVERYGQA
jgi:hypothetical protein